MNATESADGRGFTVRGPTVRARVRKVTTPKGARLEISSPDTGHAYRIDPLALESVSWQSEEAIDSLDAELPDERGADDPETDDVTSLRLVNEFADAAVEKVETDEGEFLEVQATKLGYSTRLDASNLVALAQQDAEQFSEFLSEPFGPIEGDYHGPPG